MKTFFRLFFSLFLMITAPTLLASEGLNGIAAVVNNSVITQSELSLAMTVAKQQLVASAVPNAINDEKLKQMVLQQLIDQKLQLELAERANITVSDAQVMQTISKIAQQNNVSVDMMKQKITQQNLSFAQYKKNIHDQMVIQKVEQNAVGAHIQVTAADIQDAQAQYHAHVNGQQFYHVIDIVMSTQEQAQHIMMVLKNEKNAGRVAPNDTKDLGWQSAETLPSLFLKQLKNMNPGDVVGPIQAPNGYHILKLMGVRGAPAKTLTPAQLKNLAYQLQMQKAVEKWLQTIRKTAYIKITD